MRYFPLAFSIFFVEKIYIDHLFAPFSISILTTGTWFVMFPSMNCNNNFSVIVATNADTYTLPVHTWATHLLEALYPIMGDKV